MSIQRYSVEALPERFGGGVFALDRMDAKGKYCLYADVSEKIKSQEELSKSVDKLQILLELSQRREQILMELLDEAYKEQVAPKKLERIVDVEL